jgi:hypothetical protein
MENGFIALSRKIWTDSVFPEEKFSQREAFIWLVSQAAWKPVHTHVNGKRVELSRGQCAFAGRFLARKFGWSEPKVRRFITRLVDECVTDADTFDGVTRLTICNYDKYQTGDVERERVTDALALAPRRTDVPPSDAKNEQETNNNKQNTTTRESDFSDLMERCTKAANGAMQHPAQARGVADFSPILSLIHKGADMELDVISTIKRRSEGKAAGSVSSWRYFETAINEAFEQRKAVDLDVSDLGVTDDEFAEALRVVEKIYPGGRKKCPAAERLGPLLVKAAHSLGGGSDGLEKTVWAVKWHRIDVDDFDMAFSAKSFFMDADRLEHYAEEGLRCKRLGWWLERDTAPHF